ncbi:MAG: hypothetical protein J6Y82_01165 [Bacteroidales bacterium]|nr:hypothetical protein [Bacteroidales bacterium]
MNLLKRYGFILALFILNCYFLFVTKKLKQEIEIKNDSIIELCTEISALQPQFNAGLINVGKSIEASTEIQDTNGNRLKLKELFVNKKTKMLMFCRISERYCHECCELTVKKLLQSEQNFDIEKLIFLIDSSQRAIKLQVKDFNLYDYEVYNCQFLNIPAENVMFPYYMIVDDSLTVRSIYMPNKAAFNLPIDSINLNLMYKTLIGQ